MKKVGYFFFSFIPLLLVLGIQYLAVFFMMGISVIFMFPKAHSFSHFGDLLFNIWSDLDFNTCIMIIFSLTTICVFGLWYYHSFDGDFLPDPSQTFHPMQLAAIVVLVPGAQFACSYLTAILAAIFPSWMEAYESLMESAGLTDDISLLMLCYSVILAPIGEELVFRGLTLRCARRVFPFWLANIMQAILFGIFHMNMIQGCYAAALGLILGYVCEKGGSIYYSIMLHFLFNLWGTVISQFLVTDNEILFAIIMLATTIVSLTCGFLLFYFGGRQKKKKLLLMQAPPSVPQTQIPYNN